MSTTDPTPPEVLKSGFLTSEFAVTVLVAALGAVAMLQPGMPWYAIVAALAVPAIKAGWYVKKRTELKVASITN